MSSKPLKILAVDISSLFRMAWEASQGKELSAAFTRTIEGIAAARVGFDRVIIACDSGRSFRRSIDPAYKANREDPGETYREQLRRTVDRLRCDGCVIIEAPRVDVDVANGPMYAEADDVIGTLAALYRAHVGALAEDAREGWWLTVYSGDGDMEQLVDDDLGIDVAKPPSLGGGIFDATKVLEKRGVNPAQIVDLKALAGDASDNYKPFPGILSHAPVNVGDPPQKRGPGIGDGAAVKLVSIFGSALAVFDDLDRKGPDGEPLIRPHLRKLLDLHGRPAALRGLALATLKTDLPIDWSLIMSDPVHLPIVPTVEPDLTAPPAVELVPPPPDVAAPPVAAPIAPPPEPTPAAPQSTALATTAPSALTIDPSTADWALSLQPRSASEAMAMAKYLMNSKLYTKLGTPEAIWAIILTGRERGISAMIALGSIHLVEGKPEMSADLIVAQVLRSGKAKKFTCIETTDDRAVYLAQRFDDAEPMRVEFTKDHAMKRGLWGKGNWLKMPDVMLAHRCATKAARLKWPDVTVGLYGEGEIREARPGVLDAEFEAA
jgi:5'-3' exonuclease